MLDRLDEVLAGLDRIDVHEHEVTAQVSGEPIEQAARVRRAVLAPIVDEETGHVRISAGESTAGLELVPDQQLRSAG